MRLGRLRFAVLSHVPSVIDDWRDDYTLARDIPTLDTFTAVGLGAKTSVTGKLNLPSRTADTK